MCGGRPCFTSVCGVSLQRAIMVLGGVQLALTLIATLLNSLKYSRISGVFDEDFDESCGDVEVCIGPIIKYAVFDAVFGVGLALMLIFGAQLRNHCLLWCWVVITVIASAKYIHVVIWNDWSSLQDWIAITYLLFYAVVFSVIFAFMKEVRGGSGGYIHQPGPPTTTVIINQQVPLQQPGYPAQPPPYQPQPPANPAFASTWN